MPAFQPVTNTKTTTTTTAQNQTVLATAPPTTKLQQKQLPIHIHSGNGQIIKNSDSLDGSSSCGSSLTPKTKFLTKKPINFVNLINQAEIYQRNRSNSSFLSDDRSSSPSNQQISKILLNPNQQTKTDEINLLLIENERSISPMEKSIKKNSQQFSDDTKSSSIFIAEPQSSIDLIQDSISSSCDILLNLNKSMTSIETAAGCFDEKNSSKKKNRKKLKKKKKLTDLDPEEEEEEEDEDEEDEDEDEEENDDTDTDDNKSTYPYHDSLSNTESLSRFSLTNYMTPLPLQHGLNPSDLTFSGKFNQNSISKNFLIDENESVLIESSDDEPETKKLEISQPVANLVTDSRSISPFIDSGANSPKISDAIKKRGRKKGSKGADFLISNMGYFGPGSAVYETASYLGIKSKIASFSGSQKKVKTTKELLADIQNKKVDSSTQSSPAHSLSYPQVSPSSSSGEFSVFFFFFFRQI